MRKFQAVRLGVEERQLFVAVAFAIGAAGQTAQPTRFQMN
jgi:hypothetical protein